jgi:hypothetical protein
LIQGLLVLVDTEAVFVGLDPASDKRRSKRYKLKANTAPASGPITFGADRVFTPLTDGTVLLLSTKRLRPVKK